MLLLSTAALLLPSLAHQLHTLAEPHERTLSIIASVVLLVIFALSLPASLRKSEDAGDTMEHEPPRWPLSLAVGMLALAAVVCAFVSDWFVSALEPAMASLHISQTFAGLVVVAIAGNAVENVVGASSPPPTAASTPTASSSTRRCRSRWCWRLCWSSPPQSSGWPR